MLSMPASCAQAAAPVTCHHDVLRMELLRTCREQLRSGGLTAVSLRKAAQVIGVSHASPARQFADKRALLSALAAQRCAATAEALHNMRPDCRDDLQAKCERHVAFGMRAPDFYALMAQPKLFRPGACRVPQRLSSCPDCGCRQICRWCGR
jgi:AcrR family transcriptional regulator